MFEIGYSFTLLYFDASVFDMLLPHLGYTTTIHRDKSIMGLYVGEMDEKFLDEGGMFALLKENIFVWTIMFYLLFNIGNTGQFMLFIYFNRIR